MNNFSDNRDLAHEALQAAAKSMANGGSGCIPKVAMASLDPVEHPAHYTNHPSGIECIAVTEHMNFCMGNAIKYLWRTDLKGDPIENLHKAKWYIEREIERRTR